MTKLEEIARAYCVASGVDPDKECHGMDRQKPRGWVGPAWEVQIPAMRAAVEAMRDPTEQMLSAGQAVSVIEGGCVGITDELPVIHNAMIDVILNEEQTT